MYVQIVFQEDNRRFVNIGTQHGRVRNKKCFQTIIWQQQIVYLVKESYKMLHGTHSYKTVLIQVSVILASTYILIVFSFSYRIVNSTYVVLQNIWQKIQLCFDVLSCDVFEKDVCHLVVSTFHTNRVLTFCILRIIQQLTMFFIES